MPDVMRAIQLTTHGEKTYAIERRILDADGRPTWERLGKPIDQGTLRQLRPHLEQVLEPDGRRDPLP